MRASLVPTWLQEWEKEAGFMVTQAKTKQEEIRNYFKDGLGNVWADGRDGKGVDLDYLVDGILNHLQSQGVVIQVEGELPDIVIDPLTNRFRVPVDVMNEMLKVGCVAVEPLVGES